MLFCVFRTLESAWEENHTNTVELDDFNSEMVVSDESESDDETDLVDVVEQLPADYFVSVDLPTSVVSSARDQKKIEDNDEDSAHISKLCMDFVDALTGVSEVIVSPGLWTETVLWFVVSA